MTKKHNENKNSETIDEITAPITPENQEKSDKIPTETDNTIENEAQATDTEKTTSQTIASVEEKTRANKTEPTEFQKFTRHFDKKVVLFSAAFLLLGLMAGSELAGKKPHFYDAQGTEKQEPRDRRFSEHADNRGATRVWHAQDEDRQREQNQDRLEQGDSAKEVPDNQDSSGLSTNQPEVTSGASKSQ